MVVFLITSTLKSLLIGTSSSSEPEPRLTAVNKPLLYFLPSTITMASYLLVYVKLLTLLPKELGSQLFSAVTFILSGEFHSTFASRHFSNSIDTPRK